MTQLRTGTGLTATLEGGSCSIGFGEPDWLGPLECIAEAEGLSSPAEPWTPVRTTELRRSAGPITWSIRSDPEGILVLTTSTGGDLAGIANGTFAEPTVGFATWPRARSRAGLPEGTVAFGFQYTEFALPTRASSELDDFFLLDFRPPVVEPLLLVAPDGRTLLLAPLDAFHDQVVAPPRRARDGVATEDRLRFGWHGDLDRVPLGFHASTAIVAAESPTAALARWAQSLRLAAQRDGATTHTTARDGDVLATRLSYWTDNGAAYWYRTEPPHDVSDTLRSAVGALREGGLPVGAVQLDSWFYPHEVLRPFDTDERVVPPTGLVRWEPRPDILPDGIHALRRRLGHPPLVAHCRHLSSRSPYTEVFDCWVDGDQAHPTGSDYYAALLEQAASWGVVTFEHDWLIECWLGVRGLRSEPGRARRWQEGLDAEAARSGLTLQWCMASPADFMQTVTLRRVTSIRTSGDHGYLVGPGVLWSWFCYVNALARVLGLWPFKDVFRTDSDRPDVAEVEALLSALSAGPVGVGDRVGRTDATLVRRTCPSDGVLVKPDVPVAAIDRCFAQHSILRRAPMVATCWTDHAAGRWTYAVALNCRDDVDGMEVSVGLDELGIAGPSVVWDWRARSAYLVDPGERWVTTLDALGSAYVVAAPVLAGDVALVGDPDVFVTAGDRRIRSVAELPGGGLRFDVLGAGEMVAVVGWSGGGAPRCVAWGSEGAADLDVQVRPAGGGSTWRIEVPVGPQGWTRVTAEPAAGGQPISRKS